MKRKIIDLIFPAILAFLLFSCEKQEATSSQDDLLKGAAVLIPIPPSTDPCYQSVPLIAGQDFDNPAGTVSVTREGTCLKVKFEATGFWVLSAVHVQVVTDPNNFFKTKVGNPKIGNFPINVTFPKTKSYETDCLTVPATGTVYIAAHAEVCNTDEIFGYEDLDLAAICANLPETAKLAITASDGSSYITSIITEGGWLDGSYRGWCIDAEGYGIPPNVDVLCSLGDLTIPLSGVCAYTGNVHLINYILNQDYLGDMPVEGFGAITSSDIQKAIWILIDGNTTQNSGLVPGSYVPERYNWIVNQALEYDATHETEYLPECDGVLAVILIPRDATGNHVGQASIIEVPVECEPIYNCETAWAKGYDFPGDSWAMFFKYCN